jgi:hypothetical protein
MGFEVFDNGWDFSDIIVLLLYLVLLERRVRIVRPYYNL